MTDAKKQFEEKAKESEHEIVQLKQVLVRFRCQKKVLVTEIRNMKAQTEGQVAVAMAEASEARMVNKRLKKQNELLLTQIRTLVDDSREAERKLAEYQKQLQEQQQERLKAQASADNALPDASAAEPPQTETSATSDAVEADQDKEVVDDESTVPYTLSVADIALLNGQAMASAARPRPSLAAEHPSSPSLTTKDNEAASEDAAREQESDFGEPQFAFNPHRARLVAFLRAKDPSMLSEVEEMLTMYKGVEASLFDSLELKYSFMQFNE